MSRFNEIAKEWDAKPRRLILAENIFKGIIQKTDLTDDLSVLDIGTGTGLLLIHLVPHVKQLTGIDNSQGMLNILQEKIERTGISNVNPILFDAEKDELAEKQYDLVVSSMTFHHFTRPDIFLKQVYRSIKPGGKVCIGDLDKEDGTFHTDNAADDVKHFGFEKDVFDQWLKDAGFKNTGVEVIFEIDKNDKKYPVFLAYGEKL